MTPVSLRRSNSIWSVFLFLAVALADRWLKELALSGVTRQFGIFHFVLWRNRGLVFSLPMPPVVGVGLIAIATLFVAWLGLRHWQKHGLIELGTSLMILGAASNLYDRLRYGFVIDWASFGPWFPVFNLADLMVATGLVLYLARRVRN
jgi:signal peptidase II